MLAGLCETDYGDEENESATPESIIDAAMRSAQESGVCLPINRL